MNVTSSAVGAFNKNTACFVFRHNGLFYSVALRIDDSGRTSLRTGGDTIQTNSPGREGHLLSAHLRGML